MDMQQVINGKRYDTETAERLTGSHYGYSSDFDYLWEDLYRTKKGAYFIAGEGGPRTSYRTEVSQNIYARGEAIRPLTEAQALDWLETHTGQTDNHVSGIIAEYFKQSVVDA